MREYEFTLKFSYPAIGSAIGSTVDHYIEALAKSGCDDALVGVGVPGRIALSFNREARSAFEAMSSAIKQVKQVIPGAKLVEATPDLVGLTDIADVIGCSRQNMRKLMLAAENFPTPVHEGKTALWRLFRVLIWLRDSKDYEIEQELLDVADTAMRLNIASETVDLDDSAQRNIRRLVS